MRVSEMEPEPDPALAWIREVRHRISEECGHDPKRLVEHYMKLEKEKYRDRLVKSVELRGKTEDGETDASEGLHMPSSVGQLVEYYHRERYLFEVVNHRFHIEHSIGAFHFFSIVVWKANRAKSKVAKNLLERKAAGESDLETIVRRLTGYLYQAPDARERLRLLFEDWSFRLPMASAILTVFWPDEFTVYDIRVCGELGSYHQLAHCTNFDRLWKGYRDYVSAVNRKIQDPLSLRDKDRCLWALSAATQLQNDINSGFRDTTD